MQWVGEGEESSDVEVANENNACCIFQYKKGLIYKEFLPQKTTVSAELFLNIIRRLCKRTRLLRPELWANNPWL